MTFITEKGPQMFEDAKNNTIELAKAVSLKTKKEFSDYSQLRPYLIKAVENLEINAPYVHPRTHELVPDTIPAKDKFVGCNDKLLKECLQRINEWRTTEPSFFKFDLDKNVDTLEVLQIMKDITPFVKARDVVNVALWTFRMIHHVQRMAKTGRVDKHDAEKTSILFDCTVKGSGKSMWATAMVDALRSLGGSAESDVEYPLGSFYNGKAAAENILVAFKERKSQIVDETVMQNIFRHEPYMFHVKNQMSAKLQANAWTIGSTNGYEYCNGDRGLLKVGCIAKKWIELPEEIQKRARASTARLSSIYKWNCDFSGFLDFWNNKIVREMTDFVNELEGIQNSEKLVDKSFLTIQGHSYAHMFFDYVRELKESYPDDPFGIELQDVLSKASVSTLAKFLKKRCHIELTFSQKNALSAYFNYLVQRGIINKVGYESDNMYVRYNLSKFASYEWVDTDVEVSALKEVEDTQKVWDKLIQLFEQYENKDTVDEPTEDENNEDEIDEEAEELKMIESAYKDIVRETKIRDNKKKIEREAKVKPIQNAIDALHEEISKTTDVDNLNDFEVRELFYEKFGVDRYNEICEDFGLLPGCANDEVITKVRSMLKESV